MPKRIQKQKASAKQDKAPEDADVRESGHEKTDKLKDDLAELLEEIDDILATQAEDFATTYRQAGGQ